MILFNVLVKFNIELHLYLVRLTHYSKFDPGLFSSEKSSIVVIIDIYNLTAKYQ